MAEKEQFQNGKSFDKNCNPHNKSSETLDSLDIPNLEGTSCEFSLSMKENLDLVSVLENANRDNSENAGQAVASCSQDLLELPSLPRSSLIRGLVQNEYPALFNSENKLNDRYGITDIQDQVLLNSRNNLFHTWYKKVSQHHQQTRETFGGFLAEQLMIEVKHLYSLGKVQNFTFEGDINNYQSLQTKPGDLGKHLCASMVLGYTLLAFTEYTRSGRFSRMKKLEEKIRLSGEPLDIRRQPLSPLLQNYKNTQISLAELNHFKTALQDAVATLSNVNESSVRQELNQNINE